MTMPLEDSRDASLILNKLKKAIAESCEKRLMQRTPHLVLLSRKVYNIHLKPLLVEWMLLWLVSKRLKGIANEVIIMYLLEGPRAATPKAKEAVQLVQDNLGDEYIKMLNLSHDWLTSFLPHVLSKINRVSYGLLSPLDLEKLLAIDPNMPKSRKLLAVPFVGKDVPSRASEFAHPDIVIGLTILAYRYEGLRKTDFLSFLKHLRDMMRLEVGPYNKRRTCKMYAEWVHLAGGKVRGWNQKETLLNFTKNVTISKKRKKTKEKRKK
eukprot:TRINITY_DN6579_c0_g1_i1.p1 TRINITY_DN6579_c0_g1~~TRINITY_DN6579_c0_g1_i1.p1  ORF type:complete len:266 (+),score=24.56 TRINITY_DN6579_c0_g1_i1:160-957(+)